MQDHQSMYAKGQTFASAWDLHQRDPTIILYKAVHKSLAWTKNLPTRRTLMARLYLFPDENIPDHIRENICDQIRQVNPVYQKLEEYDAKQVVEYPKIIDYPTEFTAK